MDTVYRGESGRPSWMPAAVDVKGFGRITNLAVATANDFDLAASVATAAAGMTTPDLRSLVTAAAGSLGIWGAGLNLTRELTPVLTSADGKTLLDRATYVEDASGGYYVLKSGAQVRTADGAVIARPTLQQVLAQAAVNGASWHLEQAWSPSTRGTPAQFHEDAPYLAKVVNGRVEVLDYGVKNADGTWSLASGALSHVTRDAITTSAHAAGTEWRVEALGHNSIAAVPVQKIGLDIVNGTVRDYTVEVTDDTGTFVVWARNLDRALALQAKQGTSLAFNLRNYALDFASLEQQVNSSDDSRYRIEVMTPAQLNFALNLNSIIFQPQMLTAGNDNLRFKRAA